MLPGLLSLFLVCPSPLPAAETLERADAEAHQAASEAREKRVEERRHLARLRKDLRYLAEELDRDVLDAEVERPLADLSAAGGRRLLRVRGENTLDPALAPVLDRLETLYGELPRKDYAASYASSLLRMVAEELRWAAEHGRDEADVLRILDEDLKLPDELPTDAQLVDALGLFPVDVPLSRFKKLGPVRVFLMKHRLRRPAALARTTAPAVVRGAHHVLVGVELEGTVTWSSFVFDGDTCFNLGDLHVEITPEWRLSHPGLHIPKKGDRVRVRGWTYYDVFHKAEREYDPEDPVLGLTRPTLWEIHPAQEIELLPPAPPAR